MRLRARPFVVAALLLAACGGPVPSASPGRTLTPISTAQPTSTVETTSTLAPTQTPQPTPSYSPPPPPTSLRVDGLAKVAVERLRQVVDPANPSAHPRQNRRLDVLVNGAVVLLTNGPRSARGRDYWQVFDDSVGRIVDLYDTERPLGWVPAMRDGTATLRPFQPECPSVLPTTAAEVQQLQGLRVFTGFACFGSREIVLTGRVRCEHSHGDGILGAPFFDSRRSCTLDGVYVSGQPIFDLLPASGPVREIEGGYEVRGQFDHPDSRRCTWIPFGTGAGPGSGPPDPGAVASCRQIFVVTAVEEL